MNGQNPMQHDGEEDNSEEDTSTIVDDEDRTMHDANIKNRVNEQYGEQM